MTIRRMAPDISDPIMDGLGFIRTWLESESDRWSFWLRVGTAAVVIGVVIEFVALIVDLRDGPKELQQYKSSPEPFIEAKRLLLWKRVHRASIAEFIGCLLVGLGVVLELYADGNRTGIETKLRANNASAQDELTRREREATAQAVDTVQRVGGLDTLVQNTKEKVEGLDKTASDQNARIDARIAALSAKEKEVSKVISAAREDENALRASANTIVELRQQIHDLTADRTIDVNRVARKIEAFSKTPVVFFVSDDRDAINLANSIGQSFELAHWDLRDNKRSDNAIGFVKSIRGREALIAPARGVAVVIAQSDDEAFTAPAKALENALSQEQLRYVEFDVFTPEQVQESHLLTGVIHVIVGSKN